MAIRLPVYKTPQINRNGDPVLNKDGSPRYRGDAKSGGMRFTADMQMMKSTIDSIMPATLNHISVKMRAPAQVILTDARRKSYAQQKWKDHPERHRGVGATHDPFNESGNRRRRAGAKSKWPHNLTAAEGLFIYIRPRKTFIELGLSHDPQTVYVGPNGRYNYGQVLETGFGGKFAVIAPTLARHYNTVMTNLFNSLRANQSRSAGGGGAQRIAPGWGKQ